MRNAVMDRSVTSEILRFLGEQSSQPLDTDAPTKDDLLRHYRIQAKDARGKGIKRFLRCLFDVIRRPKQSDEGQHLRDIEALATVFCDQNPGGGTGISFGALLQNYLYFKFVHYGIDNESAASLVGGSRRRIQGGNFETVPNFPP